MILHWSLTQKMNSERMCWLSCLAVSRECFFLNYWKFYCHKLVQDRNAISHFFNNDFSSLKFVGQFDEDENETEAINLFLNEIRFLLITENWKNLWALSSRSWHWKFGKNTKSVPTGRWHCYSKLYLNDGISMLSHYLRNVENLRIEGAVLSEFPRADGKKIFDRRNWN